jgi:hypothetical protein
MSIFSRLRKRGDESGAESPPNAPPEAPAPKASPPSPAPPSARAPEPPRPPVKAAESPPPPPPSPARASTSNAPPRGNVQSPVAGAIAAPAALASPRPAVPAAKVVPSPAAKAPPLPAAAAGAVANAAPAPIAVTEPAGGSLDLAIALALESNAALEKPAATPAAAHGKSTASDDAALRETFEELAVAHVTPIRNAMMEVRFGEAQASWLELGRPALKSLRTMASEVGHAALVAAVDGFVGAIQAVLEPGQPSEVTGPSRETLLAAYAPLASCLPRAFALEGERDRREPIVVRALLEQVAGFEPLMIDKLMAAGLGTLAQLFAARADEIAAVTGIPEGIAAAVAARLQAFHRSTPAALATVDPAATIRELDKCVEQLRAEHAAFEEAARGWTEHDRHAKKQLRERRQATFLQVTIVLVRLGEIDAALRLPKFPFARRLDDLDRIVAIRAAAIRAQPAPAPASEVDSGPSTDGSPSPAVDTGLHSGPHPVAA